MINLALIPEIWYKVVYADSTYAVFKFIGITPDNLHIICQFEDGEESFDVLDKPYVQISELAEIDD
jgi:hypothetical protein